MRGRPIILHYLICLFYLLQLNIISLINPKMTLALCYYLSFAKMEFCFYLEKKLVRPKPEQPDRFHRPCSLSCYLAQLGYTLVTQPVCNLSSYLAYMSIVCHATLSIYSLSCYFKPVMLLNRVLNLSIDCYAIQPVMLTYNMNTNLFHASIQLGIPKQFPKPPIALYAHLVKYQQQQINTL